MNPLRAVTALRELRGKPLWRLLAADKSVLTIALLQQVLLTNEKVLPVSILYERLERSLDELREAGEDVPRSPQAYVAEWLAQGWLVRRLALGAHEEDFELSTEATTAVRFVTS